MNGFFQGLGYGLCNYIVPYIPFWCIRKSIYKLMGMKIGQGSRILMRVKVLSPSNIELGERVYINEYCYLDGRGGLKIGNDTSISVYSYINTGYHLINNIDFTYAKKKVIIEDHVFIGARSNILSGAHIKKGDVICAGSTVKSGEYEPCTIYSGVPAVKCGSRDSDAVQYSLGVWKPWFR